MKYLNDKFVQATIRHLLGFAGAYLVSKGLLSADLWGNLEHQLSEIIFGGLLGGGALMASLVNKTTPTPVQMVEMKTPMEPRPPKGYHLSERSLKVLAGVDAELQTLFKTAIINSPHDFVVYHGYRTEAEQKEMLASGDSWVSHSKHQDGKAVDIYMTRDGGRTAVWDDHNAYAEIAEHVKKVARRLGIKIVWGGDWKTKRDYVHFELA